jgi:hypothetical protein
LAQLGLLETHAGARAPAEDGERAIADLALLSVLFFRLRTIAGRTDRGSVPVNVSRNVTVEIDKFKKEAKNSPCVCTGCLQGMSGTGSGNPRKKQEVSRTDD